MFNAININNKYLFNAYSTSKISKFLYSDFYYLSVVLFFVVFWALGYTQGPIFMFIGLACILLFIAAILILQKDVLPVIPPLFMAMCIICAPNMPSYMWAIAIFAGILALAVVFHLFYYRNAEYRVGKLFLPQILLIVVILLGGIGSRFETTQSGKLMAFVLIGMCPLFVSFMMMNYVDTERDILAYFAKIALYFGVLITIELALYYIIKLDYIKTNIYNVPHLGWGISNTVATFFLITFPFGFYLFVNEEKRILSYIYLLLGVVEYLAIFPTTSRGALIFGSIEFLIVVVVTAFLAKGKKRKQYYIFAAIMIGLFAIAFGAFYQKLIKALKIIFNDGMQDSGRFQLYREALACFFEYPIFGVGFGYAGSWKQLIDTMGIYQFHDTILQMLACIGIIGLLAYLYYYYVKLEIIFEKPTNYSLYLLIAYIGYEGYSLINTGTIQGFPTITFVVALTVAQEIATKQNEPLIYGQLINRLKNIKHIRSGKEKSLEEE